MLTYGKNRGFALLFVLSIAGLFALSVTILYTQNYITSLQVKNEIGEQQARNGALFALNLALARLQNFAGNDDIISAKANNFNDRLFLDDDSSKNITGLWKILKEDDRYSPAFLCWLNSRYDSSNFESIKAATGGNYVCLVSNDKYSLQVPKRKIQDSDSENELQWAFVIEDESQKIDLSLSPVRNAQNFTQICAQHPNLEPLMKFSAYDTNSTIYRHIDFLEQFYLVNHALGEQVIHNQNLCTVHSYGIYSNLNGLKKEFNLFLEENKFDDNDTVFQPQPECNVLPPTWKLVKSFIKQAQSVRDNAIQTQAFLPMCRPQYRQNYPLGNLHDDIRPSTQHGIYPILTQLLFDVLAGIDDGYLVIKIRPKFVLWNPYSLSLQLSDYQLATQLFTKGDSQHTGIYVTAHVKNQNVAADSKPIPFYQDKVDRYLQTFFATKFSASFKPGEVKIFSLQKDCKLSDIGISCLSSGSYGNCFIIKTNLKIDKFTHFSITLSDKNGSLKRNSDSWYFRLSSDGQIYQEIERVPSEKNTKNLCEEFSPEENEKFLFSFSSRLKSVLPEDFGKDSDIHWLKFANPRAPYINRALFHDPASPLLKNRSVPENWSWCAAYQKTPASVDLKQVNFLSNLALFDIPAMPNGVENLLVLRNINWTPFGYLPTYTFGNSDANPYIPLDSTFVYHKPTSGKISGWVWSTHANVEALFDYAYLLNETFFDNFFCVPQNNFHNYLDNQRLRQLYQAQNISAENTLIKGAFNVHTCDFEPWLAYLTSIYTDDKRVKFPKNQAFDKICPTFSYDIIKNLAKIISNLVVQRHFFPTLSAFVNRQKSQNCGLLQQAINDSKLNNDVKKHQLRFNKNKTWFDDSAANCYLEDGLPNVVDQGDILQVISNFITTRGDTFKVTAYGEYKTDSKIFKKKCEAIVQRVPEFVNPRENAPDDKKLSPTNQLFGRRLKVILFRWCD